MITADNITDEQILELRARLVDEQKILVAGDLDARVIRATWIDTCELGLFVDGDPKTYRDARARCAEILNARAARS